MNNRELSRQLQIIKNLFKRTRAATSGDIEIQSHWARYLCVLSAGFLENALTEVYVDFSHRAASPHVASFARVALSRIHNPNAEVFVQVAYSFSKSWGDDLKMYIEENGRKEAIDSIMKNRHRIAHGKTSDITVDRLDKYIQKSLEVIEFIERQLV